MFGRDLLDVRAYVSGFGPLPLCANSGHPLVAAAFKIGLSPRKLRTQRSKRAEPTPACRTTTPNWTFDARGLRHVRIPLQC
jgi:hypothetical protein